MSRTNQVCITCAQRDTCQYYNPNRTLCVPVMTGQEMQVELIKSQEEVNALRQEVAEMNKEREFWQQIRIQAAIAAMQGMIVSDAYANTEIANSYTGEKKRVKWDENKIAKAAIAHADALVEKLKKGGEQ